MSKMINIGLLTEEEALVLETILMRVGGTWGGPRKAASTVLDKVLIANKPIVDRPEKLTKIEEHISKDYRVFYFKTDNELEKINE